MRKYFLGFVFLLAISVFVTSQYQEYTHNSAAQSEDGTSATVTSPDSPQAKSDGKDSKWYTPSWNLAYKVFGWPEGITVWALFLTLMVIGEQTRETAKAATATENTVKLMMSSSTQWVELEPYGLFTKTEIGQHDPPAIVTIHPRWKVINNTPLPFTLKTIEVKIGVDEGWESYVFDFDELISPAKQDNFRAFFVPFKLSAQETTDFLKDGIELSIAIKAWFIGVSGKEEEQLFGDMYFCKVGHLEINYPIGKGPQHQYTEKDDSPSTIVADKGFRTLEPDSSLPSKPN